MIAQFIFNKGRHFIGPHPGTWGAKMMQLILTKNVLARILAFFVTQSIFFSDLLRLWSLVDPGGSLLCWRGHTYVLRTFHALMQRSVKNLTEIGPVVYA